MPSVGAFAANLHKGARSEYLAQYVFASFGAAISVPQQEDGGVDLYCTMTETVGKRAWPRHHFTVQVKSTMVPWSFESPESVRWLIEHPLPLLLCVVDKSRARFRLYHTMPRYFVWATGEPPASLQLVPEDRLDGESTKWENGTAFSLSAPIVDRTIDDLLDGSVWSDTRAVIEAWLFAEEQNLARYTMRVPTFSMPHGYTTNSAKFHGGEVYQGDCLPHRVAGVQQSLGEILPWLAQAYSYQKDIPGATRAALLLRYLFPQYEHPGAPDTPYNVSREIDEAMEVQPRYVHDGIDQLASSLDAFLTSPRSSAA